MLIRKAATIDKIEGKQATLLLENGQELYILKEELGAAAVGDQYVIQILPEAEAALQRDDLAKTLLNQILSDGKGQEGTS